MSDPLNQFEAPADPDDLADKAAELARAQTAIAAEPDMQLGGLNSKPMRDVNNASALAVAESRSSENDFVEFELRERDYIAAYSMASPLRQRFLVFIFIALCIYEGAAFYHSNDLSDLTMAAVFFIYIIILRISLRRGIRRFYKQLNERDRKVTYSIEGDDIKIETERSMILLDAEDIQKVNENSHYLLLYKTTAFFYVIPKDRMPAEWIAKIKNVLQC